jgi:hypothetical protein
MSGSSQQSNGTRQLSENGNDKKEYPIDFAVRENLIRAGLKYLYISQTKEISDARALSQASVYADFLKNIPTEFLENLFKFAADSYNDIPTAKDLKRTWFNNSADIKVYYKQSFSVPDLQTKLSGTKEYTGKELSDLKDMYPKLHKEIDGNCTLSELMQVLTKEIARPIGRFGQH